MTINPGKIRAQGIASVTPPPQAPEENSPAAISIPCGKLPEAMVIRGRPAPIFGKPLPEENGPADSK
jgi:hypothetical protein